MELISDTKVYSWNYMPPILVLSSAQHFSTHLLVIVKSNARKDLVLRCFIWYDSSQQTITCSKSATEAQE